MAASDWMKVGDVEDIRHALRLNRGMDRIAGALARKTNITLPAIMEYGCLRWAHPELPELPATLQNSVLGRGLQGVVSPFGPRTSGRRATASFQIDARPCEFMSFTATDDLGDEDGEMGKATSFFLSRFGKSAVTAGFSETVKIYLEAGLMQMMENAVQHACTSVPMLAGYAVMNGTAQFTVVDVGRGVLAALRENDQYKDVATHGAAIRKAIQPGVTSHESGSGGNGFLDIFHALAIEWGLMRFRSGEAYVVATGAGLTSLSGETVPVSDFPGFQVSVTCRATEPQDDLPTI